MRFASSLGLLLRLLAILGCCCLCLAVSAGAASSTSSSGGASSSPSPSTDASLNNSTAVPHAPGGTERWVFVITPSKSSTTRLAGLTNVAQAVAHVRNALWIVIEDAPDGDPEIAEMLARKQKKLGLTSVYLSCPRDPTEATRGNTQRNCGLQWLLDRVWPRNQQSLDSLDQQFNTSVNFTSADGAMLPTWHRCATRYHVVGKDPEGWELPEDGNEDNLAAFSRTGAVYYADDDNTFDSDLLEEIRDYAQYLSIWPVGAMAAAGISTPIVNLAAKRLLGFYDGWQGGRQWPVDMASFAVDLEYMYAKDPRRAYWFVPCPWEQSQAENAILMMFGRPNENKFTVLSNDATLVRVWHTKSMRVVKPGWVPKTLRNVHLNFDGLAFYRSMIDPDHEYEDMRKAISWL